MVNAQSWRHVYHTVAVHGQIDLAVELLSSNRHGAAPRRCPLATIHVIVLHKIGGVNVKFSGLYRAYAPAVPDPKQRLTLRLDATHA